MASWATLLARASDSRGNRLLDYHASQLRDGSRLWFDLSCCDEVAEVVFAALSSRQPSYEPPDPDKWTHRIRCRGPYVTWMPKMFELLKEVLVLQTGEELALALALDFYKVPPEGDSNEWTNTAAGSLVNHKYWKTNLYQAAQALDVLAGHLGRIMDAHPWYKAAEVVVSIPGSEHKFGETLAARVASNCGKQLVCAQRLAQSQGPAKMGHASSDLQPFGLAGPVGGKEVVIVDDVYKSGITMRSVASAASALGASRVLGLVGARTMRRT